jgi:hypothetical protein
LTTGVLRCHHEKLVALKFAAMNMIEYQSNLEKKKMAA